MSSGAVHPHPSSAAGECFDDVVLPHLDAAYRLARWMMRNEQDAQDAVQEASLRAWRYFRTFKGGNGRAWFLRIVRNACNDCRTQRGRAPADPFDEERHCAAGVAADPEALLLQRATAAAIDEAIDHLPERLRKLLVLRELDGLSYREMADVTGAPIGSVMSGLWRARQACRVSLNGVGQERPRQYNQPP